MTESKPYNGLLGLDRLPNWAKILIWAATFILTVGMSIIMTFVSLREYGFLHISGRMIYVLAPALGINCLAGTALRLAGIHWRSVFVFWIAAIALSLPTASILVKFATMMR